MLYKYKLIKYVFGYLVLEKEPVIYEAEISLTRDEIARAGSIDGMYDLVYEKLKALHPAPYGTTYVVEMIEPNLIYSGH